MELITVGKMTEAEFYHWKTGILSVQLAKERSKLSVMQLENMKKDLEIHRLKIGAFAQVVAQQEAMYDAAKQEYEALRLSLSQELGVELKDVIIDETTFEIKVEDKQHGTSTPSQD